MLFSALPDGMIPGAFKKETEKSVDRRGERKIPKYLQYKQELIIALTKSRVDLIHDDP